MLDCPLLTYLLESVQSQQESLPFFLLNPEAASQISEELVNTESFMWPTIALIGLMLFLLTLVYLWKETPSTPWVTYEKLLEFFEKHDLPRWLLLPLVVVSFAFRPQGKTFLLSSLGFAGFGAIAAIWGSGILDFFLDLIRFFYGQPSGKSSS